jgi:hypothetical protein
LRRICIKTRLLTSELGNITNIALHTLPRKLRRSIMDRLQYELPFIAIVLGAFLFFRFSVYFGSGCPQPKRPNPAVRFQLPLCSTISQPTIPITETSGQQQAKVTSESDFTAGWWTSSKVFGLERRAIFSKVSMQSSYSAALPSNAR